MEDSKSFFKLKEKPNVEVFWNGLLFKPLCENRMNITDRENDITSKTQQFFTNTKLTKKSFDDNEKLTVHPNFTEDVGFYNFRPKTKDIFQHG